MAPPGVEQWKAMRPYEVTLALPVREPATQWETDLHTDSYKRHAMHEGVHIGDRNTEEGASNFS